MKAFNIAVFFLLINSVGYSQHCAWDFSGITTLEIKADTKDSTVIPNLKVIVVDSLDRPIMNYIGETRLFLQNARATTQYMIDNNHPIQANRIRFWFAKDNYVHVGAYEDTFRVQIIDVDGEANGGAFESQFVTITNKHIFGLCNGLSNWDWEYNPSFVEDYEPVVVILKKLDYVHNLQTGKLSYTLEDTIHYKIVGEGNRVFEILLNGDCETTLPLITLEDSFRICWQDAVISIETCMFGSLLYTSGASFSFYIPRVLMRQEETETSYRIAIHTADGEKLFSNYFTITTK